MALGLLTFGGFGPLTGIPAIVVGTIGLRRGMRTRVGRVRSIAGILLGVLGSVVLATMWFVVYALYLGMFVGTVEPARPDTYELAVDEASCVVDDGGLVMFDGTITNMTYGPRNFVVRAHIRDARTGELLASPRDPRNDVRAGDTVRWEMAAVVAPGTRVTCEVAGVDQVDRNIWD